MNMKGFTLIELLIVIGITTILLGLSTINLVKVQQKTTLTAVSDTLIADLKSQQIKAMKGASPDGSGGNAYWVYFTNSNEYILFSGSVYNPTDPKNFTVSLDEPITISLNPDNIVIFSQVSGEAVNGPNAITLTNTAGGEEQTITINKFGVITDVN